MFLESSRHVTNEVLFIKKLSGLLFHIPVGQRESQELLCAPEPKRMTNPLLSSLLLSLEPWGRGTYLSKPFLQQALAVSHQGVMWAWAFERFPQAAGLLSSSIFVTTDLGLCPAPKVLGFHHKDLFSPLRQNSNICGQQADSLDINKIAVFSWSFFPPFHFYTEDSGGEREKVNRKIHRERSMCWGRRVKGNKLKWLIEVVCNSALFIKTSSTEKHSCPGRKKGNNSFYFSTFISCYHPNPSATCIICEPTEDCGHSQPCFAWNICGLQVKITRGSKNIFRSPPCTFKILLWEQPSEHRACYKSLL